MGRRGNGEGTIYYSEKLNKWIGQYTAGIRANGKLNRKSVYGNSRKEAKEKLNKKLNDLAENRFVDTNNIILIDLTKKLINDKYESNTITPSTYARYKNTIKHIEDNYIGKSKIQKITEEDLKDFINSKKNLSNSYIDKIYELLNMTFRKAVEKKYIESNPLNNVLKPISIKKDRKITAFTLEEQQLFVEYIKNLKNDTQTNILMIALNSGMRIGEILALRNSDINLKENTLSINRTLTKDENYKVIIGDKTKTYTSERIIPITIFREYIINALKNAIKNQNDLLFCQEDKNIIDTSNYNSIFKRICKNIGITKDVNIHMLRHTYATRCIEAGMNAAVLQKLLGHKDIKITMNTYAEVFDRFQNKELDKLNDYLLQNNI